MEESKPQTLLWTETAFPYRVTIPAEVLNEVRISVVDAFYSVPRGGVEIGGVFFGFRDGETLNIQTTRPIRCEYASGPSFNLSTKDQIVMAGVVGLPDSDPELAGMTPLGWYHSHTRSEIFLSPSDLQLYNEFFPEKWQFALVLRPVNLQPTRAGFFVRAASPRESRGQINPEAPSREIILDPPFYGLTPIDAPAIQKPAMPAVPAAMPQVQPSNAVQTAIAPVVDIEPADQRSEDAEDPAALPDREPVELGVPSFGHRVEGERRSNAWAWILALILIVCAGAAAAVVYWPKPGNRAEIGLETFDGNGTLMVRWDRESSAIRQARGATLEFQDGDLKTPVQLTPSALARGGFMYLRHSPEVSVRMKMDGPQPIEEFSNFKGSAPPPASTGPAGGAVAAESSPAAKDFERQAARLAKALDENRRIRTELINETMGAQDLRQTIDKLTRELAVERARNAAPKQ